MMIELKKSLNPNKSKSDNKLIINYITKENIKQLLAIFRRTLVVVAIFYLIGLAGASEHNELTNTGFVVRGFITVLIMGGCLAWGLRDEENNI